MKNKDTKQYDLFSSMTLEELISQEHAAMSFLKSSSKFLADQAMAELWTIRDVMKAVHNYNWLTKKVKVA